MCFSPVHAKQAPFTIWYKEICTVRLHLWLRLSCRVVCRKGFSHSQWHGEGRWCHHGLDAEDQPAEERVSLIYWQFLHEACPGRDTVEGEDAADRNCRRKFKRPASSCNKDECWTGCELLASGSFACCLPWEAVAAGTSADAEHSCGSWHSSGAHRCWYQQGQAEVCGHLQHVYGGVDISDWKIYHVSAECSSKRYWKTDLLQHAWHGTAQQFWAIQGQHRRQAEQVTTWLHVLFLESLCPAEDPAMPVVPPAVPRVGRHVLEHLPGKRSGTVLSARIARKVSASGAPSGAQVVMMAFTDNVPQDGP